MKKSIIALLLVVSMVLGFTLTAFADAGGVESGNKMDDLTVGVYNTARTDSVPLKDGDSYTITFHNVSNDLTPWQNYYNFVLVLSATQPDEEEEKDILYIRADRWCNLGVNTKYFPADTSWAFGYGPDWNIFATESKAGFDVRIVLSRVGNQIYYDSVMGSGAVRMVATAAENLPEVVNVALTGQECVLTNIVFTKGTYVAPQDGTEPLTITGFLSAHKDAVALSNGKSVTLKFHHRSTGLESFQNFALQVKDAETFDTANEIVTIRADNFGWGNGTYYPVFASGIGAFEPAIDLPWLAMNARGGYDVEVTLSKNGNDLIYSATLGGNQVAKKTATASPTALPDTVYVFLTGEQCVISDYTVTEGTYTPPETEEPQQAEVVKPGELNIVGFNTVKSDSVALADGTSVTFKFHNVSTNSAENYHNFVLITNGTDKTGIPQDVLSIRADNFGWGNGIYFPVIGGSTPGTLTFNTNIKDWEAFKEAAKAGFDVELTLSRSGKNLTYAAKMGEYTVDLVAVAGEELPELLNVYLTGQECKLSNISYEVTSNELGSAGSEEKALRNGGNYTFTFNSKAAADVETSTYAFLVKDGAKTLLTIYADGTYEGDGTIFPKKDPAAAIATLANMPDGTGASEAEPARVDISRTDNAITYTIYSGEGKVAEKTVEALAEQTVPDTVTVSLTGEGCTLSDIIVKGNEGQALPAKPFTEVTAISGDLTVKGISTEKTDAIPMKDGEGYTITFHNVSRGASNWHNFILGISDAVGNSYIANTNDIAFIRADSWIDWGGGNYGSGEANFKNDIPDWADFQKDAHNGVDVELTITRVEDTLSYYAAIGKYHVKTSVTSSKELPETVYVYLTGQFCALTDITSVKGTAETLNAAMPDVTPPSPPVPTLPPVVTDPVDGVTEVEKLQGSLTANDFFNRKTGAVALKSGESLTLTFKNQSRGVENFHNYTLALVGATGADYTGIDQEILIIRADNYGWGGGLGDFGTLNFVTNVTDWAAFVAAAQAGLDVEILVERVDDTVHYLSKMGDYTFELTATSAKALPETVYVFLTGEKVSLTNIASVKGEAGDIEPIVPEPPETAEKIEGDLTVGAFRSAASANIPLWDGGEYTFKFHNKSVGAANWENFVLGVTTGREDVIVFRADNWILGGGKYYDEGFMECDIDDWAAFVAAAQAGFDVELTLKRDGDTLSYTAKMGDYTVTMTSAAKTALPETVYVFLSGEKVELTGITTEGDPGTMPEGYEPAEPDTPDEPDTPELVEKIEGDLAVKAFDSARTDAIPLYDGGAYTLKFHAKSTGDLNWHNFVLGVTSDEGDIIFLRADNYILGRGGAYFDDGFMECNIDDWAAFLADAQAGFDVELTLSREGNTLIYTARMGDLNAKARMGSYTVTLTATAKKALPAKLSVFLTGEEVEMTGITTEGAAGTVPTEPDEPDEPTTPTEPETTEPETYSPKIEGTLDITGFFSAKTNMVPLRSGESYTFTFTNTSKGSSNWENFVLAVVGATGAAYTGAEQEILILRADNWGWGGGMSDFVAPDAAEGNKLVFDSNIDWDQWVAACKAGVPVTVTISRKGDTLTYDATIGEWYVKLTATSGKALPKTAYVFFTGENCTLSDIQTVSAPTYTSPKTGDTPPAILWVALLSLLAALSAAGVVVTKKLLKK